MSPERLAQIRKLLDFTVENGSSGVPAKSALVHALKDAVHEIEDLQKQIEQMEREAYDAGIERDLAD